MVESKRPVNPARSHPGPAAGLRRRTRLALIAVLSLLVLVAGTGSTSASSQKDSSLSTDWRLAYTDSIDYQANVFASFNSTPYFIFTEVYDLLLNYNLATGAPDIHNSPAYKYKLTDNGKTITYWLRKGMRWSDGKPFTSADVVFSYKIAHLSNVNCDLHGQHQEHQGARPVRGAAQDEALRRAHPVAPSCQSCPSTSGRRMPRTPTT